MLASAFWLQIMMPQSGNELSFVQTRDNIGAQARFVKQLSQYGRVLKIQGWGIEP
jgi:hypothetical protein